MCGVIIRRKTASDVDAITAIADLLPEWFTQSARREIPVDASVQDGFVAVLEDRTVGFILFLVWEAVAHISWLGVHPEHQRRGIGKRLVEHVEGLLRPSGVEALEVKTLSDTVEYEPYERTRAFYQAAGFEPCKRVRHDNPECPESLHLRKDL